MDKYRNDNPTVATMIPPPLPTLLPSKNHQNNIYSNLKENPCLKKIIRFDK